MERMRTKVPQSRHLSLEGVHSSVEIPDHQAGFWEQWRAFVGPAILVSVGYMDPGNWGTDLQGGARFKYGLLWVVGVASLMAIFMQVISARLGVVTGKDLAQCCRDWYPRWTRWPNWLMSEVAIGACDLAELLGSAVALNLLFHIPLLWAVIITGLNVLLLLTLQRFGMRTIEAIVLLLIATIGVCYFIEIFVLPQTQPSFLEMGRALVSPRLVDPGAVVADGCCQHAACSAAAGKRPEHHHHRYARRASRDGRLHALANQALRATAHHPNARHPASGLRYRHARGEQRYRSADAQSSGARAAASVRHVPTPAFHEFQQANGDLEERMVSTDCRLGQRNSDHRDGHLRPVGLAQSRVAGRHRRVTPERQKRNNHVRNHSRDIRRHAN